MFIHFIKAMEDGYTLEEIMNEVRKVVSEYFADALKIEFAYVTEHKDLNLLKLTTANTYQYETNRLIIYLSIHRDPAILNKFLKICKMRAKLSLINNEIYKYTEELKELQTRSYQEFINPILTYIRKCGPSRSTVTQELIIDVMNHCDLLALELINVIIKEGELQDKLNTDVVYETQDE
jgi:hypothetical protein